MLCRYSVSYREKKRRYLSFFGYFVYLPFVPRIIHRILSSSALSSHRKESKIYVEQKEEEEGAKKIKNRKREEEDKTPKPIWQRTKLMPK
jgi:hypothetical protein